MIINWHLKELRDDLSKRIEENKKKIALLESDTEGRIFRLKIVTSRIRRGCSGCCG